MPRPSACRSPASPGSARSPAPARKRRAPAPIRDRTEALNNAFHKVSEAMYERAQQAIDDLVPPHEHERYRRALARLAASEVIDVR